MESPQTNRFITPTLQSNWNYAINEVLKRMNNVGIGETWKAIETLYHILPPTIYDKVQDNYKKIVKRVDAANNGSAFDFLAEIRSNSEVSMILEELAIPFFRQMYDLLYRGGYLEKQSVRLSKKDFAELESEET